jgi:hypothetical protein
MDPRMPMKNSRTGGPKPVMPGRGKPMGPPPGAAMAAPMAAGVGKTPFKKGGMAKKGKGKKGC